MNDYLDFFADWYPEFLGNHFYPVRVAKTFTMKEREELLQTLTEEQKVLLEQHRKYRIRSLFLKNSYMKTTQWRFSELKINPFYPEPLPDGTKLTCKCGRPLKFQFLLQSTRKQETIALGINHFADHLNIPIEVAREIQKGVNEIDIAVDELLWLKKNQVKFPEQVWRRYCYAVFRNNQLAKPIQLNQKLPKRIVEFREVQMPIYIADYEALETEIRRVNQQAKGDAAQFLVQKELFESFYRDFLEDLATTSIYLNKCFLTKKSRWLLPKTSVRTKIPRDYFHVLLDELQQLPRENKGYAFLLLQQFNERTQMLTEEIVQVIVREYVKYGFEQSFFLGVPRVIRNGLLRAIRLEKEAYEQVFAQKMTALPDIFFQTLALLLKSPETQTQPEILTAYIQSLFGEHKIEATSEQLILGAQQFHAGRRFEEAFALLDTRLQGRLKGFF